MLSRAMLGISAEGEAVRLGRGAECRSEAKGGEESQDFRGFHGLIRDRSEGVGYFEDSHLLTTLLRLCHVDKRM